MPLEQSSPEDDIPDVEWVLVNASGGSPRPQHILGRR